MKHWPISLLSSAIVLMIINTALHISNVGRVNGLKYVVDRYAAKVSDLDHTVKELRNEILELQVKYSAVADSKDGAVLSLDDKDTDMKGATEERNANSLPDCI